MEEKNYLRQLAKVCPLWSSSVVCDYFRKKGTPLLSLPILGVAAQATDEEKNGVWVWRVKTREGTSLLPVFNSGKKMERLEQMHFRPLKNGAISLFDDRLYVVNFDRRYGFRLHYVFFFYHQIYAEKEAACRGFGDVRFNLCKVYASGQTRKFIAVCWVGKVLKTGQMLLVKLFQEDVERLKTCPLSSLSYEAIEVGEVFSAHDHFLQLCREENGAKCIKEVKPMERRRTVSR